MRLRYKPLELVASLFWPQGTGRQFRMELQATSSSKVAGDTSHEPVSPSVGRACRDQSRGPSRLRRFAPTLEANGFAYFQWESTLEGLLQATLPSASVLAPFFRWFLVALLVQACGPRSLDAHLNRSEEFGIAMVEELNEAEKALDALEIERAEQLIDRARTRSADPEMAYSPDRDLYRQRLLEAEEHLKSARKIAAKVELDKRVAAQTKKIATAYADFHAAIEPLSRPTMSRETLEIAQKRSVQLEKELLDGSALEKQDPRYAAEAIKIRKLFQKEKPQVDLSAHVVAFMEGPLKSLLLGQERLAEARSTKKLDKIGELVAEALGAFKECKKQSTPMIAHTPKLAFQTLLVQKAPRRVKSLAEMCEMSIKTSEGRLAKIKAALLAQAKASLRAKKQVHR